MSKIECPDCQGFGYLHDKETRKTKLCKTCFGYKVVEEKRLEWLNRSTA